MALYKDSLTGQTIYVGNEALNPELIAGKTKVSDSGVSINATTLQPTTPITPSTPTYPNATYPPAVEPTKVETPQTDTVSKMISDLTANSGLAEEMAGYKSEQEKAAGLEAMRKTEADYIYQYKQLENEWKNLQIESQKVPYQVAEEFTGRAGVKQQGLMSEAEQRKITLKSLDVSAKANTVNALLLGTQGLIDSAQKAVNRAVSDKFAVREANRKTQMENLELLLKDPKIDQETKDKAAAVAAQVKRQGEIDDKKKEDSKTIMEWAVDIASKIATDKTIPPQLANQIMDIARSENPDVQKAFGLYSPYGAKVVSGGADIAEFKAFFPNVDITTPQGQQQFLNWKAKMAGTGKVSDENKPLDILDVGRYNELYPEAGITINDTYATANAKVAATNTPEAKTRSLIVAAQTNGNSYDVVVKEINNDATIKDKPTALKIAQEVYGIAPEEISQPIYGKGTFAKISLDDRIKELKDENIKNGFNPILGLTDQLRKEGYPHQEVYKRLHPVMSGITGVVDSISNFLFGK